MEDERVGVDHADGGFAGLEAEAVVQLHRAEVGQEGDRGGGVADAERGGVRRVFEGLALRSHGERDARPLRAEGEVPVDRRRRRRPARHRRDEQRRGQGLAEETHARVDLVEVELRQRLVLEDVIVERVPGGLHARLKGEGEMLGFPVAVACGIGGAAFHGERYDVGRGRARRRIT